MKVQSTTRSSLSSIPAPTQSGEEAASSPFAAILGTQQLQRESPKPPANSMNETREQDSSAAATTGNKSSAEATEANPTEAKKSSRPNSKPEEPTSKRAPKDVGSKTDPGETADKPDAAIDEAAQHSALLIMMMAVAVPPPHTQPASPTNTNSIASSAHAAAKLPLASHPGNAVPQQADSNPSWNATADFAELITASHGPASDGASMSGHDEAKPSYAGARANAPSSQSSPRQPGTANTSVQTASPAVEAAKSEQAVITDKPSAAPELNFGIAHDSKISAPVAALSEDSGKTTRLEVDTKSSISVVHSAASTQHARRESASSSHTYENRKDGNADQQQVAGTQVSTQSSITDDAKSAATKSESAIASPQLSQTSMSVIAGQQGAPAIHSQASSGNHEIQNALQAQPANATHTASAAPSLSSARLVAHQQYSEVQLNIHSQDLGAVQIRATMRAGQIGAAITAERPEAREALASAIPALHQTLRDRDVRVEQITIADRTSTLADLSSGTGTQSGFSQQQSRQNLVPPTTQYAVADHEPVIAVEPSRSINESALVDIHA